MSLIIDTLHVDPQGNVTLDGQPFPPSAFFMNVLVAAAPARGIQIPYPFTFGGATYQAGWVILNQDGTSVALSNADFQAKFSIIGGWSGSFPA